MEKVATKAHRFYRNPWIEQHAERHRESTTGKHCHVDEDCRTIFASSVMITSAQQAIEPRRRAACAVRPNQLEGCGVAIGGSLGDSLSDAFESKNGRRVTDMCGKVGIRPTTRNMGVYRRRTTRSV